LRPLIERLAEIDGMVLVIRLLANHTPAAIIAAVKTKASPLMIILVATASPVFGEAQQRSDICLAFVSGPARDTQGSGQGRLANPNGPFARVVSQIGQALRSGDLGGAQQALSLLPRGRGVIREP
jgi:hypothetical protein